MRMMVVFVSVITINVSGSIYSSPPFIEQKTDVNWVRGVGVLTVEEPVLSDQSVS